MIDVTVDSTPTRTAMELGDLKRLYREARDNTDQSRREAYMAFDYYHNKQLDAKQIKVLRDRKQPEIYINRIAPAVNGILGVLRQGETDPRAFPRNNTDLGAAEVATDSLRYAADNCRWSRVKERCSQEYLIGGIGAMIVEVDDQFDPIVRQIRYDEFIYDPHSRDPDFEDARYLGLAKWMYAATAKRLYPGTEISAKDIAPVAMMAEDEDKPEGVTWGDSKRDRVMVVELYINEGGWQRVVFWGGGVLDDGPSPYTDTNEKGEAVPICPIVAQSCFIDRDNGRYGIVKAMLPVQDEINMRRSRMLHLANSRQVKISDPNAFNTDAEELRKESARPDGVLPVGVDSVQLGDQSMAQFQLLQESKAELERMGPNPAVLGQSNKDASGRAQLVRQQAGLTELQLAISGVEDLDLRVFRQMWLRIRQYWNEPKLIRVTDDVGAPKFMTINEPEIQEIPAIVQGPDGQPMVGTQQQIVGMKNRPAEMDMDIIIDAVPDTANVQSEQFAELVRLAGIYGPQEVPFDDLLEASSLPRKRQLIEKREARKQEAAQAQAQGQGPQQQMMMEAATADIGGKKAKARLDEAKAEGEELKNAIAAQLAGVGMPQEPPPDPQFMSA